MRFISRLSPPMVAVGMFCLCLLLGVGTREAAHLFLRSSLPARPLAAVRSGPRGMRVENLTGVGWASCVVTIEGGVSSMPFFLPPNSVTRLGFGSFRAGATPLDENTIGFARAFHETSMLCRDGDGRWQAAAFR